MNVVPEEGNTDTEGGSLNPDLRIREKGIPGNRTLPIERANEVCPMFLKSIISLKNNLFPKQLPNTAVTRPNQRVTERQTVFYSMFHISREQEV